MKTLKFYLVAFLATLALTSCSNENEGVFDPVKPTDPTEKVLELKVNPTNANNAAERNVEAVKAPGGKVTVNANFKGDKKMRRLYMTKNNLSGNEGPQPYEYPLGSKKSDGSINLDGDDKTEFTFQFEFDAPEKSGEVVQYVLWTTNARGDFRDIANSNSIADEAYGTVTIKADKNAVGEGSNFSSFSTVLLASPLADGTSKSFISLFNGKTYAISQGEEYAALWDFGYYYGNTAKASFASAANYPSNIVDVVSIGKTDDLNNCYFKLSSKSVSDFDAITKASELNFITKSNDERVKGLEIDNIVEFVDAYGNKGLIKVTNIVPGFGTGKKIEFDVKVQLKQVPVKG